MNKLQKKLYQIFPRSVEFVTVYRSVYFLPRDNIVSFSSPPRGEHDEGIINSNTNQQKDRNKIDRLKKHFIIIFLTTNSCFLMPISLQSDGVNL